MKKGSLFKKVWDFEKLYALYFQILLIFVNNSSDLGVFKAFGYCWKMSFYKSIPFLKLFHFLSSTDFHFYPIATKPILQSTEDKIAYRMLGKSVESCIFLICIHAVSNH